MREVFSFTFTATPAYIVIEFHEPRGDMISGAEKIEDEFTRGVEIAEDVIDALTHLPIVQRLKIVESLLLRLRGDKRQIPMDPRMVIAAELLSGTIGELEKKRSRKPKTKATAPGLG
jgi:hypothetical protein